MPSGIYIRTEETKRKMSGVGNAFYGKHYTKETIAKMSKAKKGRCNSEEHNRKISEARMGMKFSEEHKKHLCENHADFCGNKSPHWKGGISREPYSFTFDKKLKYFIRKRDKFICQFCRKTERKNRKALCIHHIDYNKKNSKLQNLISLCHHCNSMANADRDFWICFFQRKIEKIYKYQNILGVA